MAAEAIVSVIVEQLISITARKAQEEVRLVTGVKKEVKKLTSNFQAIQAVLVDAKQRQVKEKVVADWLDKLKDVSYDMEDALDEWNTAILKLQIEGAPKKKVCFCIPLPRSFFKQVVLRRDIGFKIKKIDENLDLIFKKKDAYNFNKNIVRSIVELERSKTTSFVDVSGIHGRDVEKDSLISKLLCENLVEGKSLPIISIVAMGGIGKTTLAQLVYNDEKVKSYFHKRIWICVSEPFDEIRIAKAIIEGFTNVVSNFGELQSLLDHIHKSVVQTKFLLILDDVWNEDNSKWEPLYNTLNNGLHGSKILVTTRKTIVARRMKSITIVNIGQLPKDESWSLFIQLAHFDRAQQECEILDEIGREIINKCKGLPLAIKTIGSLLRFKKTREQWKRILDSEMWELEELGDVFGPLLLSYNDLPFKVQQCFSYCAIFPKDYDIEKDELIKLWMAQGYLGLEQNQDLEVIGEEYFDILVMRSFFQEFKKDEDDNIIGCKMHDIVHDFTLFLAKKEGFAMKINSSEVVSLNPSYEKVHHLMLIVNNTKASLALMNRFSIQKIRSLLVRTRYVDDSFIHSELIQPHLLEQLTCLRSLEMKVSIGSSWFEPIKNIPREIGKLIHLRYLNMMGLNIAKLPEAVCDLYNLQTLDLRKCREFEKLPEEMGKLVNLRHLEISYTPFLKYMPKGVEKLSNLRTLSKLIVGVIDGGDAGGRQVCSLGCLNNFKHLRGSLMLRGLSNVLDEGEAKNTQLKNIDNIVGLSLDFAYSSKDEAVLEALESPPYLKELEIKDYGGIAFPTWILSLTHLKMMKLNEASKCEYLPALGKLPLLETLKIEGMKSLKRVGNEFLGVENSSSASSSSSSPAVIAFPKLNSLTFSYIPKWEEWEYENTKDIVIMPSLSSLVFSYCPNLKALPYHLLHSTSLHTLHVWGCYLLKNWCQTNGIRLT